MDVEELIDAAQRHALLHPVDDHQRRVRVVAGAPRELQAETVGVAFLVPKLKPRL